MYCENKFETPNYTSYVNVTSINTRYFKYMFPFTILTEIDGSRLICKL